VLRLQLSGIPCIVHDMAETTTAIADRVRGIAAEKRFTQERIATALGLARSSVSQRLNGTIPFTAPELLTLSHAFDVPVSRFFPEERAA